MPSYFGSRGSRVQIPPSRPRFSLVSGPALLTGPLPSLGACPLRALRTPPHAPLGLRRMDGDDAPAERAERFGDGRIPAVHDVLVADGGLVGRVPDPRHQLLGSRPGRRREGGGAVAKVVEAKALDSDRFRRGQPDAAAEVAPAHPPALGRGEDEARRARLGPGRKVFLERPDHEARERHGAETGLALGRAPAELPVDLRHLLGHLDGSGGQVHAMARPARPSAARRGRPRGPGDRKSTRLNSSHVRISYAVFCLKKKKQRPDPTTTIKTKISQK